MEKYRGVIVELGEPFDARHVKIYMTWFPGNKMDAIIMCFADNAVEFGFAHYDGNRSLEFDDKENANCVLKALSYSRSKTQRGDTVYFKEGDDYLMYYFKNEDVVFVVSDDYVYSLGSLSEAVEAANDIGEEVAEAVGQFVDEISADLGAKW